MMKKSLRHPVLAMDNSRMERFTVRARKVFALSQDEAESLHHDSIGTEHVLLGLLREEGGIAARVLRDVGILYPQARSLVKDVVKSTTNPKLELTANTKKLLEMAVAEAWRRQQNFVGTEHLLMALTHLPESKACILLKHLNADIEDIYQRANNLVFGPDVPAFAAFAAIATIGFLSTTEQEAVQLRSPSVEPEHLLLALLNDADSSANRLMKELDLSLDRLRVIVQKIKRDIPKRQVNTSDSGPIWAHDTLQFVRMYPGYFPDSLLMVLVREWWVLSDIWRQAMLNPKQIQAALDRAQVGVTVRYPRHATGAEYMQMNLNFYFPRPLRHKIRSLIKGLRFAFTGKKS